MQMYWGNISEDVWNKIKKAPPEILKKKANPVIYFDMDGTLTVFNKNATMEEVFSSGYFRNLTPHREMIWLAKKLHDLGFEVAILSKATYSAIPEKYEWLKEHVPFIKKENIYFVPLEADKCNFVPEIKFSDTLIDDYWKNLTPDKWNGVAIKCVTDINTKDPTLPWVELKTTTQKNLKMITWAMLRNFASEAQKGNIDIYSLKYIKAHCGLEEDEFYSICEGFNINTAMYGDYGKSISSDFTGRYIDMFKDYDTFRNLFLSESHMEQDELIER